MKKKWIVLLLAAVTVAVTFSTCGGKDSGGGAEASGDVSGKVVGSIPSLLSNSFHQAENVWRVKFAAEYGVTIKTIDGEFDQSTIIAALDQFIAEGVDGIIVHSIEAGSVVPIIDQARAAGIEVVTYYQETPNNIPFVAINESKQAFEMGVVAATQWKKAHPNVPVIYSVVDYNDIPVVQEMRTRPFIEGVLSVAPDAQKGLILDGGGTRDNAYKAAQDIIQGRPDTNVFYGASSDYSMGVMSALQETGRGKAVDGVPQTEIVIGTDATGEELTFLFDPSSSFKVTMGLTPKDNGKKVVDTIVAAMKGEIDPDKKVTIDTFDKEFDYWSTTVEDARAWYSDQYGLQPDF
jgi:ribose transport system substrate-binding protein